MVRLDARVEQRDRHAAAVEAGQARRPAGVADARREPALLDQAREDVEAGYVTRTG